MKKCILIALLMLSFNLLTAQIDYDAEIKTRQEQLTKIESSIRSVEKKVSDTGEKIKQIESQRDALKKERIDLEAKIKDIKAQIEKLKS